MKKHDLRKLSISAQEAIRVKVMDALDKGMRKKDLTHKGKMVKEWLADHVERIELFLLPVYSPELNPDELVNNQDVKTNSVGKHSPLNVDQLAETVEDYLMKRKNDPEQVKKYFHGKHVRYAA